MDEKTRTLIKIRLERAREDLDTAEELLTLHRYRAVVNRAYYALFGITTAVLLTKKLERSKHTGVEAAFNQYFIKTGIIEIEFGKIFDFIRKKREESDYASKVMIDKTTATNIVRDAKTFMERMEKYLSQVAGKYNNEARKL